MSLDYKVALVCQEQQAQTESLGQLRMEMAELLRRLRIA